MLADGRRAKKTAWDTEINEYITEIDRKRTNQLPGQALTEKLNCLLHVTQDLASPNF